MQFDMTNKNIRVRFILEKRKKEQLGESYTYENAAEKFMISTRTFYTWITQIKALQHLPRGHRAKAVLKWLQDGVLETFFKNRSKK